MDDNSTRKSVAVKIKQRNLLTGETIEKVGKTVGDETVL